MSFKKENYLLLLNECKKALAPFKVARTELAQILERQRITDELIYELIEIAQEENVIFAQTENDFILVGKCYECDFRRVHREEFSSEELNDIERNAQLKSQLLLHEIDLDSSFKKTDSLTDKLDIILDAIDKVSSKAEDASMAEKLGDAEQFLTLNARDIYDEYIAFIESDELDSDDLESSLDEFHHSDSFEDMLEETLIISFNPNCYEYLPQNEFYLALLPISRHLTETLAQIREEYRLKRDARKAAYSDKHSLTTTI